MSEIETSIDGGVGIITINRPEALNAVNHTVMDGLLAAAAGFDADEAIGCIVLTGAGDKAFVAGADIKEMAGKSYMDMFMADKQAEWERFAATRTPMIAAVNGFALGGGCEIAMMCDIVIASEKAKFGQPEIKLGVIPGWSGTQRLTHAVGKAKAMDLILTGRMMDAEEAERAGLVARIVPHDQVMTVALEAARAIAGFSRPSVLLAKDAVNRAFETPLQEGIRFERRAFYSLFATEDQKEGMDAFANKREPVFRNK
ncbi:enoyl-CoA hydratase-related protein [Martelella soudanensis]|uniref:enoyl-CoA hydratase-related protein n=1 Tax=unclassified Martelella TaxID=2629616 RepID=UPI0015DFFC78|nr:MULTISPECIES: enoyl-CoA hydratase-related protein [unclassified Martelella]